MKTEKNYSLDEHYLGNKNRPNIAKKKVRKVFISFSYSNPLDFICNVDVTTDYILPYIDERAFLRE